MWSVIAESFDNLTPILWASQISGLIGLVIIGISYLFKKKAFLAIATVSFVFFILEQAFAGLYAGLIVSSVCLVRNVCMFIVLWKRERSLPIWALVTFIIVMWIAEIICMSITHSFGVWDNYLPPAIVTMSTFTQNSKNEFVVKIGAAIHETGFLVYYLIYNLPFSILRQAILVVATIVGIILLTIQYFKKREEKIEYNS